MAQTDEGRVERDVGAARAAVALGVALGAAAVAVYLALGHADLNETVGAAVRHLGRGHGASVILLRYVFDTLKQLARA